MGMVARWGIPMHTPTDTRMTDTALLTLVQWLSPAFPVGGYAYSHGLEWAVTTDDVTDATGLQAWLSDVLTHGAGWTDAVLLAHAMRDGADHGALGDLARALAPSKERLVETCDQGQAFVVATNDLIGATHPPAPLPVAVGRAAADLDLGVDRVVALYLHAFTSNLVQAGVRFIPLGQAAGQSVLAALHPVIEGLATQAMDAALDQIGSASFGADLASMRHEDMDVRIFKT